MEPGDREMPPNSLVYTFTPQPPLQPPRKQAFSTHTTIPSLAKPNGINLSMFGLGRSKKASTANLRSEHDDSGRSTTPTPGNPDGKPSHRSGLLAIRVLWAEGLSLPAGTAVPPAVQSALNSQQAKVAASVSPSSVTQQRLAKTRGARYYFSQTSKPGLWLMYSVVKG